MNFPEPLSALPPDALAALEAHLHIVRFPAYACIFKIGSAGDSCYLLDEGQVRGELHRPEMDSDSVLAYMDAGQILGELTLLDRQPRCASAYAHTPVVARQIRGSDIDALAASHLRVFAAIQAALGRSAALKLRQATDRLAEAIFTEVDPDVEEVLARAEAAQREIQDWPEERIDALLLGLAQAVAGHAEELAAATVHATRMGSVPDKTFKNRIASLGVCESLAGKRGLGPLSTDAERRVTELASPVGIVFGLVPMTAPVATAIFKALICVKARNALVLSFHSATREIGPQVGALLQGALRGHGAPADLVQWVKERSSRKKTWPFMRHCKVALILATGGQSMVKAAYSSGRPAIGVGPANTPVLVAADADLDHAAHCIVASKAFDNGLVCGAEHNLVVHAGVRPAFVTALERHGAAVLAAAEAAARANVILDAEGNRYRVRCVGQSAARLAEAAGIRRDRPPRLLVVPADATGLDHLYACEKLFPVVSLFTAADDEAGVELCLRLLRKEGAGHTAIIHTRDADLIERFGALMPASRVLVNAPCAHGIVGLATGLTPSLTLGCGTYGGNSTTDNVTYRHLLNIRRIAPFLDRPLAMHFSEPGASP